MAGAGSLQGSIILSSSDLGLTVIQNFGTATSGTLTPGAALGGATFANVTLSSTTSTTLYYDPNGSGNCSLGKQGQGSNNSPTLSPMTNCIGDYLLSNVNNAVNQVTPQPSLVSNPEITLGFTTPEYQASFIFAVPGATGVSPTSVKVYENGTLVDSAILTSTLTTNDFVNIVESTPFNSIQLSYVANSYSGAAASMGYTWNAVLGNVEASSTAAATPEPATMGLMGIGLAGVGYFFRRRKA
jgi:hypothetical protein